MNEVRRTPIDFDALELGSSISIDKLERILEMSRHLTKFQLAVLNLSTTISKYLTVKHGRFIAVAQVKGELRVLTDSERVEYHEKTMERARRDLRNGLRSMQSIDVTNITDDERKKLERQMVVGAAELLAMKSIRKQFPHPPRERSTPSVLPPRDQAGSSG